MINKIPSRIEVVCLHCLGMPLNLSGFMELERMGWMDPTPVTVTSTKALKVPKIIGLVQVSLGLLGLDQML